MSLEERIQSNKFRNNNQRAVVNLIVTCSYVHELLNNIFMREGITQQQYNILRILRGAKKPLSTLQIRQRMLDKMSDTSRIVDRLVSKKFVIKSVNKKDKRLVDIKISAKGFEVLTKLEAYEGEMDNLLGSLSDEEIITFSRLLDKIREGNVEENID